MSDTNTWQGVQEEVRRRIRSREWKPGELIPTESDLACELGCARTTVNRALRELAGAGLIERRRKSGTRVARHPTGRAVIEIPLIRREVEATGARYGYALLSRQIAPPPARVAYALGLPETARMLHLVAVHLADGAPYLLEDGWINLAAVPGAEAHDFTGQSANEWLLETVPVARGELAIAAQPCGEMEARALDVAEGTPVLTLERSTWGPEAPVTFVRLSHMPGHRIVSPIAG